MDTMLSLRIAIVSLLLRLTASSASSNSVSAIVRHPKSKRDLAGISYMTLGPILHQPKLGHHGVLSDYAQDDLVPASNAQSIRKSVAVKNSTKAKEAAAKSGPKAYPGQIRAGGTPYDPIDIDIQLTEAPSISGRSLAFPSNQAPSEAHLTGLSVNPNGNVRPLGDPAKSRGAAHFNPQKPKLYEPLGEFPPIFPTFYREPLLPVASQTIRNPIYRTRGPDARGTKPLESDSHPVAYRMVYQAVPSKVVAYPYFPLSPEFAELDKPRVLTAGTNVKLQAKPLFAFNFPSYDSPNVGSARAFRVQQNAGPQEQYLPLQSANDMPQFSFFNERFPGPTKQKLAQKVAQLEGYQALADQPQLHFGDPDAWRSVGSTNNNAHFLKQSEKIRTDVEVVDKKKPAPPKPDDDSGEDEDSDEIDVKHDDDEGYKFTTKDDEDDFQSPKFGKDKDVGESYGKSHGFQLYDEKFGKKSKKVEVNNKEKSPTAPLADFSFNSDDDEDADEYLSKFYSAYSPKHDYQDKSAEETKVSAKHESDEDEDGHPAASPSAYIAESYEEEFDKNYRPLVSKKNAPKRFPTSKGKLLKSDESAASRRETNGGSGGGGSGSGSGGGKVGERTRNNYQQKPKWYEAKYLSQEPDGFNDQAANKKQPSISFKRDVDSAVGNGTDVSSVITADSFVAKAKSTLKPINHQGDARIHTNSQSPDARGFRVNPPFHKSNISGNENGPPREVRKSHSAPAENKWLLNKRSQDKAEESRAAPRPKAISDVYVPSNPSFFPTKQLEYRSLAGI